MSYLTEAELTIYKNPPHANKLADPNHHSYQENILCGDNITIELDIKNRKIVDAGFQANGCILNTVSASKLIDFILGKDIRGLDLSSTNWLSSLNFAVPAGRQKCVLLSLEALKTALII